MENCKCSPTWPINNNKVENRTDGTANNQSESVNRLRPMILKQKEMNDVTAKSMSRLRTLESSLPSVLE